MSLEKVYRPVANIMISKTRKANEKSDNPLFHGTLSGNLGFYRSGAAANQAKEDEVNSIEKPLRFGEVHQRKPHTAEGHVRKRHYGRRNI